MSFLFSKKALQQGFSLAEVVIALALALVVILALLGLGITATTSNRKSGDLVAGQLVADQQLRELIYSAGNSSVALWSTNSAITPYEVDNVTISGSPFTVYIYATDVVLSITPPPTKGLKKVQAVATWWQATDGGRSGYGLLQASATQVLNVP